MEQCLRVIQRLRVTAPVVAQLIGNERICHVLPLVTHFDARLPHLPGAERTPDIETKTGRESGFIIRLLFVQLLQHGLRIEGVHVTGTTLHEEHDHVLGLGWKHRIARRQGAGSFLGQEVGESDGAHRGTEAIKELATRECVGNGAGTNRSFHGQSLVKVGKFVGVKEQQTKVGQGTRLGININSLQIGHVIIKDGQNLLILEYGTGELLHQ